MTIYDIADIAKSLDTPYAYDHFEQDYDGDKVIPPYVIYYYPNDNDFIADDENYANIKAVVFELYTATKDFELETQFEAELKKAGLVWYKDEVYLSDERLYQIVYETEAYINE